MFKKNSENNLQPLAALEKAGLISIDQTEIAQANLQDRTKYVKLDIDSAERVQLEGLLAQLPQLTMSGAMSGMYVVKFPKGAPHTLMKYKNGGYGSPIQGADGNIVDHAAFFNASPISVIATVFTALSIATMQYYLDVIDRNLTYISCKIDKILDFLYGDKRAELFARVQDTRIAYNNFSSIMNNDIQRESTVSSLHQSSLIALQDIEFYIQNLKDISERSTENDARLVADAVTTALNTKDSLYLALQLYISTQILTIFYTGNTDSAYVENVRSDLNEYIEKCNQRVVAVFNRLTDRVTNFKDSRLPAAAKLDRQPLLDRLSETLAELDDGKLLNNRKIVAEALEDVGKETEYLISDNGEIYWKKG